MGTYKRRNRHYVRRHNRNNSIHRTTLTEDNMRYEIRDLFANVIFSTNYENVARELAADYGGKVYDTLLLEYI